ncbi:unnamed protein product [Pleuronectes platessa]|uniref:Uncharacterized protein n=1 Tax=Pleuronectes platessa TaxID=8262 RepID=A0A9N7VZ01_PLEPL|nr:unnamed protein product [Pleuronectes platessa]
MSFKKSVQRERSIWSIDVGDGASQGSYQTSAICSQSGLRVGQLISSQSCGQLWMVHRRFANRQDCENICSDSALTTFSWRLRLAACASVAHARQRCQAQIEPPASGHVCRFSRLLPQRFNVHFFPPIYVSLVVLLLATTPALKHSSGVDSGYEV